MYRENWRIFHISAKHGDMSLSVSPTYPHIVQIRTLWSQWEKGSDLSCILRICSPSCRSMGKIFSFCLRLIKQTLYSILQIDEARLQFTSKKRLCSLIVLCMNTGGLSRSAIRQSRRSAIL